MELQELLTIVGKAAVYCAVVYVLIYCNKRGSDYYAHRCGFDVDDAIEKQRNLAVALRRCGLYLGLGIGMVGVISGPSNGFVVDLLLIAGYGAVVSVFFVGARIINDFFALGLVDNTTEVKNGNVAVGLVECGAFIATGLIAGASMMGQGGGFATAITFFIIGQLLLLMATVLYEWIVSFSIKDEIKRGNPAAGLRLGGLMVAIAFGIHGAVAYDFVSWTYNLMLLVEFGGAVLLLMFVTSFVVDWVFLPGTDVKTEIVRDRNVAAIGVHVTMQVVAALLLSAAII